MAVVGRWSFVVGRSSSAHERLTAIDHRPSTNDHRLFTESARRDGKPSVFNSFKYYQQLTGVFNDLQGIGRLNAILAPIGRPVTSRASRSVCRDPRGITSVLRGLLRRQPGAIWLAPVTCGVFSTTYKFRVENKRLARAAISAAACV